TRDKDLIAAQNRQVHIAQQRFFSRDDHILIESEDALLRRRHVVDEQRAALGLAKFELCPALRYPFGGRADDSYVAGDARGGDATFSTPHLVGRVVVVRSLAPIPRAYRRLGRLCPAPFVGEPALQRALFALQALVRRDILALFCVPAALRVTVATAPEPRRASADANCI